MEITTLLGWGDCVVILENRNSTDEERESKSDGKSKEFIGL